MMSVRYITYSDDTSSNHVIFETDKYDIELNDEKFQMMKEYLSMSDNEILHVYNEIVNILDDLTIIHLKADSSNIQLDYSCLETICFTSDNIHKDMLSGFEKLRIQLEFMFNKIKVNSAQYNSTSKPKYDRYNEAINKLNEICNIMIESFKTHPVHVVSSCLCIITNNIIEDEKDRLMKDQINEGSKLNENIISIESSAKETTTTVLYVSKNNEMLLSKMKNRKKKYLINIKKNTCTCPDFEMRKMKQGLCCKHLMEIRNKSYCLLVMNKVMDSLSQNSYNNYHVPFKEMLNVVYDKSINYNPYNS